MPYSFIPKGEEPKHLLLRRGDILRWTGVRANMFDKIVASGILPWKQLIPGGVRVYLKSDVKRAFFEGFRVTDVRHISSSAQQ